jgi:uncharacterized protein (TIGR02118 family)
MSTSAPSTDGPVKLFAFLKHKAGTSSADFHQYWEDSHAPFLAETPELRRHIRRYELHHRLASDVDRERNDLEVADAGYDGVAVQWFDSLAEFQAMIDEPKFQEWAALDATRYRDPEFASVITAVPDVILGPAGGVPDAGLSMICILRRKPGWELPEFHDHWLHHHGGLFQNIPELREPLLGYEQNHGLPLPDAAYDGVTQQWFASLKEWTRALEEPKNREVVEPDVASFLDPSGVHFVLAGPPTVVIA